MRLIDDLRVTRKLPLLVAVSAAVAALVVGALAFWSARFALIEARESALSAIVEIRTAQLSEYLATVAADLTKLKASELLERFRAA